MCAVTAGRSTPAGSLPGHRQKAGTRVPPRWGEPFWARIPSLKTWLPAAVPLSVENTTSVSSARPHSSSFPSSRPMFVSMFSIIP